MASRRCLADVTTAGILCSVATYVETVQALRPIIPVVYEALQAGLDAAATDHEKRHLERTADPHYFSYSARRTAVERLRSKGLLRLGDRGDRSALAMSGIQLDHAGHRLWVQRSANKDIPLPGKSGPKGRFYRQEPTLEGWNNLLMLWRDDAGTLEDPLWLVRPLGGDNRRKELRLDWQGPLRLSMAGMRESDLDQLQPFTEWKQLGDGNTA